jgi:hypothetical protein
VSDVLTLTEVAEMLKCSTRTVHRLDIPYRLAGGRRYSRSAVLSWLDRGGRPSAEPMVRPVLGKRGR